MQSQALGNVCGAKMHAPSLSTMFCSLYAEVRAGRWTFQAECGFASGVRVRQCALANKQRNGFQL